VFVGISTLDYSILQQTSELNIPTPHSATGGATSIAANRISYCFGLEGPSIAIDTACSSALVATHLACQSIWNHECDMALVGGVNIIISPGAFVAFCAASMLSPDGHCKAFDASANGFVRAEGAGMVVLKPLSQALANRDRIYSIVLGTAVNQDGRTSGISAPSQSSQEALIRTACQQAGIAPDQVQYVEAHGTGTALGDPIEANAIGHVLSTNRPEGQYCMIGSVKTNIGHLEAAAGVAGLIKVALALKHRIIPPNLHFHDPNPSILFEPLQLRVPCDPEPWDETRPAIAGVNSFGFGGTNAHLVMMEYQEETAAQVPTSQDDAAAAMLLPLSARSPEALQALSQSYLDGLQRDGEHGATRLADLCYTASMRRMHFDHRLSLVVHHQDELVEHLAAFVGNFRKRTLGLGLCPSLFINQNLADAFAQICLNPAQATARSGLMHT
jgi:acyl transferase domain-containing protein